MLDAFDDFRAVGRVTTKGRLMSLSITYIPAESDESVAIEISYTNVGSVGEIDRPSWFVEARERNRSE